MPADRSVTRRSLGLRAIAPLTVLCGAALAYADSLGATPPPDLYAPASCEALERAGWPDDCWRWAGPQMTCDYVGYYVGGGAPRWCGRCRCASEGTWGWDYHGHWFPRRVRLAWFCWPRWQGGEGQYQPDGPRLLEAAADETHGSTHRR